MQAPQPLPMSLQQFGHQQPTLPRERLVDPVSRAGMYSEPPMDPIHSCFAEATQLRNFINSWSRPGSHSLENIRKIANS